MNAYQRGRLAYYSGHARSANPFDSWVSTEAVDFDLWQHGWLDAREDHERALEYVSPDHQIAE